MALKILAEQVHYANVDLNHNQLNNARVQNLSAEPSSNNAAGRIFYDTDTNQLKVYNGSAFEQLVTETTDTNNITDVESILNASLVIGRDAHNQIQFSTDNEIHFKTNNETPVIKMKASGEIEATSLDISGDIDIDGTANLDAVDIDGVVNFAAVDHVMQNGANINDPSDNLLIGFATNKVTFGISQFDSTLTIDSDIIHKDDTNNKISFGTDTQSFETGGTARINISDSGLQIGSGARVTTIEDNDSLGTSDTKLATQGNIKAYVDANTGTNITSLGDIAQDTVTFTSANANDPVVIIKNTANDANGARLKFLKDKGAAGADNDEVGEIMFAGDDAAQAETEFGKISVQVGEADNTDEAGKMNLQVASSDGTTTGLTSGLVLTGHKTSDYVDVTLGSGSSSTVTIPGNLTVSGTTTTVNSTTVNLNDHNIILDSGNSTSAVVDGAGITIEGGSGDDATFTYNTTGPQFEMKLGSSYEDLQVAKLTAASLDISGDVDVDGTMEADAITVNGTALDEFISDTVGAMVSSNTETGISVTYADGDNTIDFALSAAQTTITSLLATDIKIGEDDQTKIDFETADEIHFYAANVEQVYLADNIFGPQSDSDVDLGSSSVRWKDAYVDSITVTGEIDGASLDISGNADIDGTLEADAITINGSAILAQATTSAVGCVELATTAEALAGSDSSRAVTPEGLAARSYSETIGDASATAIAVDHNLNTRDVIVQLYDVSSYDTVIADVVRTTVDRVTITFASAPASNDIRVLVTKID